MNTQDMTPELIERRKHKNARLSFAARRELATEVVERNAALRAAAAQHGITVSTARKWIRRYMELGVAGLQDDSSRPHRSPTATAPDKVAAITELRRAGLSMTQISRQVGCSISTVSRICGQKGAASRPSAKLTPSIAEDALMGAS